MVMAKVATSGAKGSEAGTGTVVPEKLPVFELAANIDECARWIGKRYIVTTAKGRLVVSGKRFLTPEEATQRAQLLASSFKEERFIIWEAIRLVAWEPPVVSMQPVGTMKAWSPYSRWEWKE
jgi:hypothetical protein